MSKAMSVRRVEAELMDLLCERGRAAPDGTAE